MIIHITRKAANKLLKKSPRILLSCKSGGCNGYEYVLEPVNGPVPNAEKQISPNGLILYTCNLSILHLLNTKLDWIEDIMGDRFVFVNPNALLRRTMSWEVVFHVV
jgi:Fe-S cluster assembly iron-binding protein IscA